MHVFLHRYDPYEKKFTEEFFEHSTMLTQRKQAMDKAMVAGTFGIILGTLGRQGSPKVMNNFQVFA